MAQGGGEITMIEVAEYANPNKCKKGHLSAGCAACELEAENKRLREEASKGHYTPGYAQICVERDRCRAALQMLYDETKNYVEINHLGDPHHNQSMKLARAALKGK